MTILIVDDQTDMCQSLKLLLGAYGYMDIETAASGPQALDYLAGHGATVGAVLTDVNMPDMNGIEVCRRIKASPQLRDIPVLVITGLTDAALLDKAFAAGAHDFIPKPVSPSELLARVRSALKLKLELDQRQARERELVEMTERLKRLNDELHRLTILDELTGIPNRRLFDLLLHREWSRAARERKPLSLIMIDVDHFKGYNDRYGHPAGDICLTKVAAAVHGMSRRPGDAAARYGGEEFAVVLADTTTEQAASVAEGMRGAVVALGLQYAGSPCGCVSISAGVAGTIPQRMTTPDSLKADADRALYAAKAAGRNRIHVSD